jgi:CubicO group peptidase (beta-lactamase class C family)
MTVLLLLQALSLGQAVDSLARAQQFSGVVLIARNGAAVIEKAYGQADREARRPNDTLTAFNLGSINKVFTQIAIRQLAGAGKLDVDSTLGRYWPDYPNADARRVTIRQILGHRSGIGGDIFAAPPGKTRRDIRSLADYFALVAQQPLQFEPGTQQRYSNAGYIVLGLLIERLSGQSYYEYVREHIYEPAGLTRTAHWPVDSLPPNTALGYTSRDPDTEQPLPAAVRNSTLLPGRGSSAGGGYSTAQDLLRFLNALRARKIASGGPAGLGIAGGAPGLNAVVEGDMPGGYDVIVMANLDPPAAEQMGRALRARLGSIEQ